MNVSDLQVRVAARRRGAGHRHLRAGRMSTSARCRPSRPARTSTCTCPAASTRQYSLCNDPREGHRYLIGVLRDPASRGGSQAMHEQVNEGDMLRHQRAEEPLRARARGARAACCWPAASASRRSCAWPSGWRCIAARRSKCTTARARAERTAFRRAHRAPRPSRRACISISTTGPRAQKLRLASPAGRAAAPARICTSAARRASWTRCSDGARRGLARGAAALRVLRAPQLAASEATRASRCKLASSGRVVARAEGPDRRPGAGRSRRRDHATSCEQGVCGTCLTRVLEGEPDHGHVPHARGTGGERSVHAVLFEGEVGAAGVGSVN